jgi:endonuclease/exonuclease/phosphatase (EEP) superfamily protein YafD
VGEVGLAAPVESGRVRRLALAAARVTAWAVAALCAVSPLGRLPFFELATHFRSQYALAAAACAGVLAWGRAWRSLALAAACAALNLAYVLPFYTPRGAPPPPAAEETRLVLMFANVQGGNREYEALFASVAGVRPDVLALAEVTPAWASRLGELGREYPYASVLARPGGSGLALFSRHPLEGAEGLDIDASTHPVMRARVRLPRASLSLLLMHPPTPMRPAKFAHRAGQLRRAAELFGPDPGPRVLVGDLNVTPWSPYFRELLSSAGLRDVRAGAGLLPTWPALLPAFLRLPIDHCLVGEDVRVHAVRTGPPTGSDHLPLVVELGLPQR